MQIERRILGNAASLGVAAIIGQLTNFGFVILVARGFGREVFAQYAFSMAAGTLACVLVTFGSISLLIRASAQDKTEGLEMLTAILPVQALMSLIVWTATIALGFVFSMSVDELSILACIVAHHAIIRITAVLLSLAQGQERMDLIATVQVGRHVLALTLGVTLALTTGSAIAGISALPIASIIFLFYAHAIVRNLLGPIIPRWDPKGAWDVAVQAFPFLVIVALGTANERLGVLMLYSFQGSDAVATFASGERIITAVAVIYTMLSAATLPVASRLAISDRDEHQALINRVARLVNLAIIPAASLLFIFSSDVITILFGDEFASSIPILQTVAWVLVVRALSTVQQTAAISVGHQRDVVTGRVVSLLLLLGLGIPMIRAAGPLGLVYAMLGAELGFAVAMHVLLRRAAIVMSPLRASYATAAACGISVAVGLIMADAALPIRIVLVVGCTAAGLWGFRAVDAHDIRYLWAILRTKRSDSEAT